MAIGRLPSDNPLTLLTISSTATESMSKVLISSLDLSGIAAELDTGMKASKSSGGRNCAVAAYVLVPSPLDTSTTTA